MTRYKLKSKNPTFEKKNVKVSYLDHKRFIKILERMNSGCVRIEAMPLMFLFGKDFIVRSLKTGECFYLISQETFDEFLAEHYEEIETTKQEDES